MRKYKKKSKLLFATVATVIALCIALCGCLTVVGNILSNLDAVLNYVGGYGVKDDLPENVVYGSENRVAVGFESGKLVAFWDKPKTVNKTAYSVIVKNSDTETSYSQARNPEYFDGESFDLEKAGLKYTDKFTVSVKKIDLKENVYTLDSAYYGGMINTDYDVYTRNVAGGFTHIDYYIASRYELFDFFNYLVIFRPNAKAATGKEGSYYQVEAKVKMGYDFTSLYEGATDSAAFDAELRSASASFEDSSAYNFAYELTDNGIGHILLKFYYSLYPDKISTSKDIYENYVKNPYYEIGEYERHFPIDEIKTGVTVSSSDQLYFAMKRGYRPVPIKNSHADLLYGEMRRILSTIISDELSEPVKIRCIYEYLINTVIYDYVFVDEILTDEDRSSGELFTYKCLYMEGVFGLNNKGQFVESERVAICDGLSKAFLCLTRIEGINSIKVSGTADGGAHAWNKVEVKGVWYLVDTTWGNVQLKGTTTETMSTSYLMVPDDDKHTEDPWFAYPTAKGRYNFGFFKK